MPERTGMVHDPEKARPGLKPEFPSERHRKVMEECTDVPEMLPAVRLPVNQAGITSKTVWIHIPQGRLPFQAEIMVNLPGDFRGIHMSRMERAVSTLFARKFPDIRAYALELCRLILSEQRGDKASVNIRGTVPQISRTPVSGQLSVEGLEISANARGVKGKKRLQMTASLGISIIHMTACPCTQAYNQGLFPGASSPVLPTHSQRCMTFLEVEDGNMAVTYEDLYECLAGCLHVSQDLLKRPDEAELVLKSHREPQFAEDVVREAALSTAALLGNSLPGDSVIRVESISLESIHHHNVKCVIECRLEEIMEKMAG